MAKRAFRFVHAGDLHLERPPYGLSEVPDHLRELFVQAPYQAAEQVFETVLAENCDALLLAGDVVDIARAGPPAIVFLIEQFSRLADRDIPVFWAGGMVDPPDAWPPSATLPENVHRFPVGRVEDRDLVRTGQTIARVQGVSCREDGSVHADGFHRDAHGLFTIGVAHGTDDSPGHEGDRVHYMALGGQHRRATVDIEPGIAHYAGTTQGRGPGETGPHGCTVVQVDETGHLKTRFVSTDVIRWVEETVEITASTKSEQLEERMEDRLDKLIAKNRGIDLLVRWKVRGSGHLINRLRPGGLSDEILQHLRHRFGQRSPAAWSVSVDCPSPLSVPPEMYDQETVLGDLLRQVRLLEEDDAPPIDLSQFLPAEMSDDDPLRAIAHIDGPGERQLLVGQAAKLGADLLTVPTDDALRDGEN